MAKAAYLALAFMSLLALTGERLTIRGYPVGNVAGVNKEAGAVSVDIGSRDQVMEGITFTVSDPAGKYIATITAKEVYQDMFWSGRLPASALSKIKPGYQVRWLLTPETAALLKARRENTVRAYREFIDGFPKSAYAPELVANLPDAVVKELNPDYYKAKKRYRKEDFKAVADKYPGTAYEAAAKAEIKAIEQYEAEREKEAAERARRAEEAQAEMKRRQEIEERQREAQGAASRRQTVGKLVNNSPGPVRFVFDEPSGVAPLNVRAGGYVDLKLSAGAYKYKVYKIEEGVQAVQPDQPAEQPQPLKEGTLDAQFDFWEADYP